MTVGLVWKNKEYLGKGMVLQRANVSKIKSSSSAGKYESNPDPAIKSEGTEYVERWLSNGFILQKRYDIDTYRGGSMKQVNQESYETTENHSRANPEYEQVFRVIHISELSSIDEAEVKKKVFEQVGDEVLRE